MSHRGIVFVAVVISAIAMACSGRSVSSHRANGSTGDGAAGTGGTNPETCPPDLLVLTGPSCGEKVVGCTGDCVRAHGVWTCPSPCPCGATEVCAWLNTRNGCISRALGACFPAPDSGVGGAGGAAGSGGMSGTGGMGASAGSGGAGGSGGGGGSGGCAGSPACYGADASFCSEDGTILFSCSKTDICPTSETCASHCPSCSCHMAPPVNGILVGACDTCKTDKDCASPLRCLDNPMVPGSGATTCLMP